MISSYLRRYPSQVAIESEVGQNSEFTEGDVVYVKPAGARCATRWTEGVVTGMGRNDHRGSGVTVEVNGLPHHVADIRWAVHENIEEDNLAEAIQEGRPARERRRPVYLNDYDLGDGDITGACGLEIKGKHY